MLSHVNSARLSDGVYGYPVTVEVDFRFGMPAFTIVGLPDGERLLIWERAISSH